MSECINNLFDVSNVDFSTNEEITQLLTSSSDVRIERIVSCGQTTPEDHWYNQTQNEFVVVLQGEARILFDNGNEIHLSKGDYMEIASYVRHRVSFTSSDPVCIWLAVFFTKAPVQ